MADETRIGDPLEQGRVPRARSPRRPSYEDYQRFVALAREAGPDVVRAGGSVVTEGAFAHGYFVRPDRAGRACRAITSSCANELFVPIVAVETVDSLDEALDAGQRHARSA